MSHLPANVPAESFRPYRACEVSPRTLTNNKFEIACRPSRTDLANIDRYPVDK